MKNETNSGAVRMRWGQVGHVALIALCAVLVWVAGYAVGLVGSGPASAEPVSAATADAETVPVTSTDKNGRVLPTATVRAVLAEFYLGRDLVEWVPVEDYAGVWRVGALIGWCIDTRNGEVSVTVPLAEAYWNDLREADRAELIRGATAARQARIEALQGQW